jgi:hypothetical protein
LRRKRTTKCQNAERPSSSLSFDLDLLFSHLSFFPLYLPNQQKQHNRRRGSVALVASSPSLPRSEYNPPSRPLSPPESPRGGGGGGGAGARAETNFSASSSSNAAAASATTAAADATGGQRQQRRNRSSSSSSLEGTPLLSKAESSAAAVAAAAAGTSTTAATTSAIPAPQRRSSSRPNLKEARNSKLPPSTEDDDSDDDDETCPTCLERFCADNPSFRLGCGHEFHLSCALEWEERCVGSLGMSEATCPVCAAPVPEQE